MGCCGSLAVDSDTGATPAADGLHAAVVACASIALASRVMPMPSLSCTPNLTSLKLSWMTRLSGRSLQNWHLRCKRLICSQPRVKRFLGSSNKWCGHVYRQAAEQRGRWLLPHHYDNAGPPSKRKLTALFYLNPNWKPADGGGC